MSHSFALVVSFACFGQVAPQDELFREGEIAVRRMVDPDGKGNSSTRNSLFINRVHFGSNILTEEEDDPLRRKPTTYYHRNGPVGFLFRSVDAFPESPFASDALPPVRLIGAGTMGSLFALAVPWSEPAIGVVGMHSGTIASYVKPFQTLHFYERNPTIPKLSLPDKNGRVYFYNTVDAQERGGQLKVIAGDVRPSIEKAPAGYYKFLFVEMCQRIYLEDVEVELITKEGIAACVKSLAPDGVVAFHTSNRYLDLEPVVTNAAKSLKFAVRSINDEGSSRGRPNRGNTDNDHFSSSWVFVCRNEARLKELTASPLRGQLKIGSRIDPVYPHIWTDNGPNPLTGMLRDDPGSMRMVESIRDMLYKLLPPSLASELDTKLTSLARSLSHSSLGRLERRNLSSDWLRKTP